MKKKIVCLMLVLLLLTGTALCSCGNMSMGIGNYNFEHVHFSDAAGNAHCATVEKWYDNETGIEVKTTEYGAMYLAEGLYILFENNVKCPFCK